MFEVNTDQPHRDAVQALLQAYENARMDGLCHEGAWEAALEKVSAVNLPPDIAQKIEALLR